MGFRSLSDVLSDAGTSLKPEPHSGLTVMQTNQYHDSTWPRDKGRVKIYFFLLNANLMFLELIRLQPYLKSNFQYPGITHEVRSLSLLPEKVTSCWSSLFLMTRPGH